jgi:transcriptional regulator with XRE-family HTH domain
MKKINKKVRKPIRQGFEHEELGQRIDDSVKKMGKKYKDLAEYVGSNPSEVSRWVRGSVAPGYQKLVRIASFCKTNIAWLLSGTGQMEHEEEPEHPTHPSQFGEELTYADELIKLQREEISRLKQHVSMLEEKMGNHNPQTGKARRAAK